MDYSAPNRFPNAPAGHCSAVFVLCDHEIFEALARDVRTNCARSLPARDAARLLDDAPVGFSENGLVMECAQVMGRPHTPISLGKVAPDYSQRMYQQRGRSFRMNCAKRNRRGVRTRVRCERACITSLHTVSHGTRDRHMTIEKSPLNRYSSRTTFEADSRTEVAQSPSNTRKRSRTSVTISAGAFASKTARRTCQSRFFTWSARTAPPIFPPGGRSTSKG